MAFNAEVSPKANWKGIIIGVSLGKQNNYSMLNNFNKWSLLSASLANVVYLSNIFSVGYFKLAPFEIAVLKGIIQTLVFGISSMPWSMWRQRMLGKGITFYPSIIYCDYIAPKNRHTISFIILTYNHNVRRV